jgi:hypothetical protein
MYYAFFVRELFASAEKILGVIVPCNTALLIDFVPMYSGIDEQPIKKNKIGNVLNINLIINYILCLSSSHFICLFSQRQCFFSKIKISRLLLPVLLASCF